MALTFRMAAPEDVDTVAEIFIEIDIHYYDTAGEWEVPERREDMIRHVRVNVLSDKADCNVVLAEDNGDAVGLATYAVLYPIPGPSGTFMMKDLFLRPGTRGSGFGEAFMHHLAGLAVELNCDRFDWTAETDNPKALEFYAKLNAGRVEEKVYFRFSGDALRDFAATRDK